ncbi:MAG: hypothetical protein ABUR63_09480 [Verrucomicrobiota bacterium]
MRDISPDITVPIGGVGRGEVCLAYGVSPDEVLWLTAPKSTADRSVFLRNTVVHLRSFRAGSAVTNRRYESSQRPHFVQRTKDGVLFVNARQRDNAPNAVLLNESGRVVRRLSLGDGLSDVRVSPAGKVWTAYFDEGVFGSGDGAAGLVARDALGRPVWTFDAMKAGTEPVADVYAFNLAAEDDAWVYFYEPFDIVRWRKRKATAWRTSVQGARAIAIRPSEALLYGDYDDPMSLRVLDLPKDGGRARIKRRIRLRVPKGTNTQSIRAFGTAHRLILWSNRDLMILENW